jgi:hypothetical protein
MQEMIAMAGFAEAAEFYALVIFSGALLLGAVLVALAWSKRWILAAIPACMICVATGFLVQPWQALAGPLTNDPDEADWIFRWRVFGFFWTALCLAGIACVLILIRHFKSRTAQQLI